MCRPWLTLPWTAWPKTEEKLRGVLQRRAIPRSLYAVHPAKLAEALGSALPMAAEVVGKLEAALCAPGADPLGLFRAPREVPKEVLERSRRSLARLPAKPPLQSWELARWLISQAFCPLQLGMEVVVQGLVKAGALKLGGDGCVEYLALGDETREGAKGDLPYSRPWPLEKPKQVDGEKEE